MAYLENLHRLLEILLYVIVYFLSNSNDSSLNPSTKLRNEYFVKIFSLSLFLFRSIFLLLSNFYFEKYIIPFFKNFRNLLFITKLEFLRIFPILFNRTLNKIEIILLKEFEIQQKYIFFSILHILFLPSSLKDLSFQISLFIFFKFLRDLSYFRPKYSFLSFFLFTIFSFRILFSLIDKSFLIHFLISCLLS